MPKVEISRKLGFPGMLDKQYQQHREQLLASEKSAGKAAKTAKHRQAQQI
jgi:hypothetical protein